MKPDTTYPLFGTLTRLKILHSVTQQEDFTKAFLNFKIPKYFMAHAYTSNYNFRQEKSGLVGDNFRHMHTCSTAVHVCKTHTRNFYPDM